MSKRLIAFVLMLVVTISCFPLGAFSAEKSENHSTNATALIYVESTYCVIGREVAVDIRISDNPGVAGAKFRVSFDDSLTLIGASEDGGVFDALDYTAPNTLGNLSPFNWDSLDAVATENGTIITLTFEVADSVTAGEQLDISVSYDYGDIYDIDLNSIAVTMVGGVLDVIDYVAGDVDGDGVVNGKDVTLIRRYNAGWDVDINLLAADANGDGVINGKDVTQIRRYNAGWDDVEPQPGLVVCEHHLTAVDANEPTCTEAGNTAYWLCDLCEMCFADAEAENEISLLDTLVVATGHIEVVDDAVAPSCFATGLTAGSHCSVCNEILIPQYSEPMIDHIPGVEATCTEDQICTVCETVLESANGHIPGGAASCAEPQRCTVCQTILVEATGHALTYVEERDPVNANDFGNCAYWQCAVCNRCYLDEDATQEIALVDTAWETYLVYFFDLENDTYTVGAYKQSEVLSLKNITPVEMKGYDFNGWHTSENFSEENKISLIPADNTEKIDLYANRSLHEYKITLLGLGREESWSYNIANGIKLTTPKWKESVGGGDCLIFSHWTDENGNKIMDIPVGEIGDRTIEANWIYKENYAVSNKDKYTYVSGVMDQYGRYSFVYEIGVIKDIVLSKQHNYTFDGLTEHIEAETKTYTVGTSAGQEVAKTISKIVSSSTEMANISRHTTSHTDGWEVGAKWKPEVEIEGIKVSAWEFSGGYSNSDTDVYEDTGFSSEKNYTENGTENEVCSTIDYYTEESVSRTVSETFIPGVTPLGNYTWARLMDVKVYAIVTYNPYTGNYVFDVYSTPTNIHDGLLYTLPTALEYDINIVSGDVLDFEIPFEQIPEMFYIVEYDANGGTGEMPKSVHELGINSALVPNAFEKEGYTFAGWKTTLDGDAHIYTDNATLCDIAAAGESVHLYAHWIPNEYTVTYDANRGIVHGDGNKTVIFGASYGELFPPTRTGYTFLGWFWNDTLVTSETIVSATENHILVAKWSANTYTVVYHVNGGIGSTDTSYHTYDVLQTLSPNGYSCPGWSFVGWSTTSNGSVQYADQESVNNLTSEANGVIDLYAIWVKTSYTWISGHRERTVTDSDDVWDTGITPEFSQSTLSSFGYTKLQISVTFDGKKEHKSEGWDLWIHASSGCVASGSRHYDSSSWETKNITASIDIEKFDELCTFSLQWGANGNLGDDWYLGYTVVTVTAMQ